MEFPSRRRDATLRGRTGTSTPRKEHNSLIRTVDILNGQDSQVAIITEVAEGQARAGLKLGIGDELLGHVQGDGHGEDIAIDEAAFSDDPIRERG